MRTYGRVSDELGTRTWRVVTTDANGYNDLVWVVTLAQCLYLNPGESPFYADYGIPAVASVLTQVQPDFYVNKMQKLFSQYFASLTVQKVTPTPLDAAKVRPVPTYNVAVVSHIGSQFPPITIPTSIPV